MLIEVENFLPTDLVDELVDFSQQPDTPWELQEMQEELPRRKISWLLDSPVETVHNYFQSLPMLSHLNFMGISLWDDDRDFWMHPHLDNDRVKVAVQIYLDNRNSPGTQFGDRLIRYGRNRGYIMYNNSDMLHGVPKQIPHEGRLSVYALYE
tara:strand:+ start:1104 stop:1559 length:456 start_codon:yes stop_codon:yes gene_type:complete